MDQLYDVIVIGGGNAALCAALSAREQGARKIALIESAPKEWRGGNSSHTRNLRCMHNEPTDVLTDSYTEDEYFEDVWRVTNGQTNESMARFVIRSTVDATAWMKKNGVRFQPSLGGTLQLGRTNAFFLGGGKALVNAYYKAAEKSHIEIFYETECIRLNMKGSVCESITVMQHGLEKSMRAKAFVIAAGGFESNREWLEEAWGPAAKNFLIRGTRFNQGVLLKELIRNQAMIIGDPTQGHAVAIDARSPLYDGGIVTRVDCVSLGIVLNKNGERFYDEGEDFWPKRYAIWGRLVAKQPDQIAYCIIDQKSIGRFMPSVFKSIKADTLEALIKELNLPLNQSLETIATYNAAVQKGTFNHSILDDCHTKGLEINKTHWATTIDEGPFYAYPLATGITFTYMGVKVDKESRVTMADGSMADNLFAAGEIMAGNILTQGYVAGFGMAIGTVFGRIAGREAAKNANA
ncbi:Fumarate reductase flavoprotein subunit precursor [Oligella ureolytica]|uniref:FAD-dependent tricarballylate dehydrogenase TcuA n=1 Tax=Oligella ureolytica TaxID=90244 RepID=A0A378XG50_9BURK|nr:FAD-dependent tricarballylate dehydrogenase TcuA [Oligella ureolytica]QPT39250.1 FAD-dependent tricarballylate dehydrogenase TcuA [Oligella ureolytica]SUA55416.1 Fumarate reductase flavoprotein subunit precursor [Oligella ureolytica]